MKKFFKDFKAFITRGNVLDMAVGVIIGSAFTAIVNSLVKEVITPVISLITGDINLQDLHWVLRPEVIAADGVTVEVSAINLNYGSFIQAIINFLIIAITVFTFVKVFTRVQKSLDINEKLRSIVQEKLNNDEELTKAEAKWLEKIKKYDPDKAPKKVVPEEPKPVEPSSTDKLLMDILSELKKDNKVLFDKINVL